MVVYYTSFSVIKYEVNQSASMAHPKLTTETRRHRESTENSVSLCLRG